MTEHQPGTTAPTLLDRVLLAADLVPAGAVVSYGDLAALVGISARRVGQVMARHGHETQWWRVVNAAGDLPADLLGRAVPFWGEEGIATKTNGRGCRIDRHRADLVALAGEYERELGVLGAQSGE